LDTFLKRVVDKVKGEKSTIVNDSVITEVPLTLVVNDKIFFTFHCTPQHLKELAAGYLMSCGVINKNQDILECVIDEKKNTVKMQIKEHPEVVEKTTLKEPMTVKIQTIYQIMSTNLNASELFQKTGGVHSVAVFDQEKPMIMMEDVARHNAVDKALGYCVLNDIDCSNKILVVSGRISAGMLSKADQAKIPMVLSKSAPTSLAIDQAEAAGITLVGFIRGEQMNIYTHPARIDLNDELFRAIVKIKRKDFLEKSFLYLRS